MKIAFTGPENSGKTSISKAISAHYKAKWYPEYAREYLLNREGKYDFMDIEKIAIQQNKERGEIAKINCYDTENIVLFIWSMFKYKKCSPIVMDLMKTQKFDHYFLCSPENIPWEEDPLREHPAQRKKLFLLYKNQMEQQNLEFTILEGSFQERKEEGIRIIDALSNEGKI